MISKLGDLEGLLGVQRATKVSVYETSLSMRLGLVSSVLNV
jgi:hypothetical protein